MISMRRAGLCVGVVLGWVTAGAAVTVTFDVLSDLSAPEAVVTVEPRGMVSYVITVFVDEPESSSGLAGGSVDLLTDLGLTQMAAAEVNAVFTLLSEPGTVSDDDVVGIAGSQNTFAAGSAVAFARGQTAVFASGVLQVPMTAGSYSVTVANASANVLSADLTMDPVNAGPADQVAVGAGFMIQVAEPTTTVPPDDPAVPTDPMEPAPPSDDMTPATGFCGASLPAYGLMTWIGLVGMGRAGRRHGGR